MTNRIVRHKEQDEKEAAQSQATPAPMVERAFRLLDVLCTSEEGLTLSELARMLDMSKGSLHGLLKTLERCGVVEQGEDRFYMPGPKIYDLAQYYIRHAGLHRFALPAMQRLAQSLGETVFLGRVEREYVRIIECVSADNEPPTLHVTAARGTRVHLLAGATGRIVLASWSPAQRAAYFHTRPLPRFTEHSTTDPEQFLASVEETARTGIGEDHGEYLAGVNAVATGIHGPNGSLVALLWVVGFASRFYADVMKQAGQQLRAEAAAIAAALGEKQRDG